MCGHRFGFACCSLLQDVLDPSHIAGQLLAGALEDTRHAANAGPAYNCQGGRHAKAAQGGDRKGCGPRQAAGLGEQFGNENQCHRQRAGGRDPRQQQ